jgi:hypothetical protein
MVAAVSFAGASMAKASGQTSSSPAKYDGPMRPVWTT